MHLTLASSAHSCPTLCNPMNRSTPGLPVHHHLPEFTQTQRPSSQWHHPAISSSVVPFSSCPQSLPASESFPVSQLFSWGGRSAGASASASWAYLSRILIMAQVSKPILSTLIVLSAVLFPEIPLSFPRPTPVKKKQWKHDFCCTSFLPKNSVPKSVSHFFCWNLFFFPMMNDLLTCQLC